jgi:hypothetical protein
MKLSKEDVPIDSLSSGEIFGCMLRSKVESMDTNSLKYRPAFDILEDVLDRREHADEYFKEHT